MEDNKYLITPDSHQGVSHITPARLATLHRGTIANNDYVLSTGQKFKAEIISNNIVRIYDGALIQGGIRGEIEHGYYRDVEISNGIIGMKKNYLIVCRWSVDPEDGRKTHQELVAVEGTAAENEPLDPTINTNLIEEGAQIHDTVLYRVVKEGLDIVRIDTLFKVLMNAEELMEMQRELNSKSIVETGSSANGSYRKYADGILEMWGRVSVTYTDGYGKINFPVPLAGNKETDYFLFAQPKYVNTTFITEILSVRKNSLNDAYVYSRQANGGKTETHSVDWYATGRWK